LGFLEEDGGRQNFIIIIVSLNIQYLNKFHWRLYVRNSALIPACYMAYHKNVGSNLFVNKILRFVLFYVEPATKKGIFVIIFMFLTIPQILSDKFLNKKKLYGTIVN
jgi:hypothetical protein